MKKRILVWSCLAFFTAACHKGGYEKIDEGEGETAQVSLVLRNNIHEHEMLLTRAAVLPEEDDFLVRLENTRAEVLREWRYDTMPSVIRMVPGSYKLVAYYGDCDNLPAFDTPYYYGETKVSLKQGDNLDTVINTSVATVKVALTFDESFDFDYDDYFVEVKTVGDSLHFAKDEEREGYFLPGSLRMRFGLKPKGVEKYYEFYPEAIRNVKAAEFYRMTLKAQSENGALSQISIITDTTTIHVPVDVELPSFMLPKAAPKVAFQADTIEDGSLVVLEGEKKNAMALISSAGGLVGLKIKVDGAAQSQGWPAEIDLMNADEAVLDALKAKGIEWDEKITAGEAVKSLVWVRFDKAISQLSVPSLQMERSGLSVCATDRFGQVAESKINLEMHPVLFTELPTEADIWAKRAEMKVKTGGANETYIEYKSPEGEWQRAALEEISKGSDRADYWVKNLSPNQEYVFRVCVGDYKSIQKFTFVTEEAAQVPNAEMEKWEITASESNWERWAINGWATYNDMTTMTTGTRHNTAYVSRSGAVRSGDFHTGTYAAELRTIGWGAGNSALGSISTDNPKYINKGMLYLGTSPTDYSKIDEQVKKGVSFASRPSSISFWYKYSKHNGADYGGMTIWLKDASGNVIASASKSNLDVASYTQVIVPLVYTNTSTKVEQIYVEFSSSDHPDWATRNKDWFTTPSFGNLSDGKFQGSSLFIDDIELIYE